MVLMAHLARWEYLEKEDCQVFLVVCDSLGRQGSREEGVFQGRWAGLDCQGGQAYQANVC